MGATIVATTDIIILNCLYLFLRCDICEACFSDSNQLKAHNLIHKGEKPFYCEHCKGKFRRRHHLMHHACPKLGGISAAAAAAAAGGGGQVEDDDDLPSGLKLSSASGLSLEQLKAEMAPPPTHTNTSSSSSPPLPKKQVRVSTSYVLFSLEKQVLLYEVFLNLLLPFAEPEGIQP